MPALTAYALMGLALVPWFATWIEHTAEEDTAHP